MARQTRLALNSVKITGKTFWQVTIPKPGGGRIQRTFKNKPEAKTFFELKEIELRNRGTSGIAMDDKTRGDALTAIEILAPFNVSLAEAAEFFMEHRKTLSESETVENAVALFLAQKKPDSRPRYYRDLKWRLERFNLSFGKRKLADITAGELEDWLSKIPNLKTGKQLSAVSRNTYALRLSTLWSYGKNRGWVTENVLGNISPVKVRDVDTGILEPLEAARILESADTKSLPYWLLGLFCGLRSAELERADWSNIHWDDRLVEVTARSSKTGARRFIKILDNLWEWLEPYRGQTGRIYPGRKMLEADRERAGLKTWKVNCTRHSYASYFLEHFKDSALLSLNLGHINPSLVFNRYRQLVRPTAAAKYWSIRPQNSANLSVLSA